MRMTMRQRLFVGLSLAALLVAVLGVAPLAEGGSVMRVLFAKNADKVDGKDAVGFWSTTTDRKGKLVATNRTTGLLPRNIVAPTPYTTVIGEPSVMCAEGGGDCEVQSSQAACPAGTVAAGGGWIGDDLDPPLNAVVLANLPLGPGYFVLMANDDARQASFSAVAVCAPGSTSITFASATARVRQALQAARTQIGR